MNIISKINSMALNDPKKLIEDSEKGYNANLESLKEKILSNDNCKIILLAGPSGSGKTTTAHILKSKLNKAGKKAEVISLDHFFLPFSKMPLQENGEMDFESVYSLDIEEIHKCLAELIKDGKTAIPVFNFEIAKREDKRHNIDISKGGILILEGLHALNPLLTEKLDAKSLFKIYISVNLSIVDDDGNKLLSSRQMRLIRRMSRDAIYRNTNAMATLKLWTSVVKGEEKYLYAYKDEADVKYVTFHSYEPCVFRDIILSLTQNLPETVDNYDYIMSAKKTLEKFVPISCDLVPENSLIREFILGGEYKDHK